MAALLQQAQQRQQLAAAASMMANCGNFNNKSNQPAVPLPSALEEEVGRRKAIMAGTPYSITKQFPWRLHEMLDLVEEEGLEEIVSFLPDGRSFKVHDPARFEQGLMRRCFNQTRYKSFQRQLNLWGFERKNDPIFKIKGTYSHPWFIRGRKDLTPLIVRVGGGVTKFKNDSEQKTEEEKNLQAIGDVKEKDVIKEKSKPSDIKYTVEQAANSPSSTRTVVPPKTKKESKQSPNFEPAKSLGQDDKMMAGINTIGMSSLYSDLLQKNPTASSSSVASFLGTFQNRPKLPLFGATSSAKTSGDDSANSLATVISALNHAEAIGCLNSSNPVMDVSRNSSTTNAGGSDGILKRLKQHRDEAVNRAALIEEAMRISAERTSGSQTFGTNNERVSARAAPVSNHELLQQFLKQQQPQQQDPQSIASAAIREIANQRTAQLQGSSGMSNEMLQRFLSESGAGSVNLATLISKNSGNNNNGNMMLEKLRLEEGIQTLMRERVRLEAAAILEERERRRLEYLAAIQL